MANAHQIFITGTDTGVGKTVLTSLLLARLRHGGAPAFALKPFCSGGRADAELLRALQEDALTLDQINPFHFEEPVAPLVAARVHRRKIPLRSVLGSIHAMATRPASPQFEVQGSKFKVRSSGFPVLLIEGAGGLLSPLGEKFDLLTIIQRVMKRARSKAQKVSVLVAAANRLGTINHTLLTVRRLQDAGIKNIAVVLTDLAPKEQATPDARSNGKVLQELLHPVPIFPLPFLGCGLADAARLQASASTQRVLLERIIAAL